MSNEPTAQQTIAGGEDVSVVFRNGDQQTVKVSQLRPSQLPAYLNAELVNELGPLSIVTGLKAEQLDELTLPSLEALLEADVRQNFSYARRFEKRRAEAVGRQFQAMREQAPKEFDQIIANLEKQLTQSLASSPALPAAAAGAPPAK